MKEFTDDELRNLFDQKSAEFEPADSLELQWKNIASELPRRTAWRPLVLISLIGLGSVVLYLTYRHDAQLNSNKDFAQVDEKKITNDVTPFSPGKTATNNNVVSEKRVKLVEGDSRSLISTESQPHSVGGKMDGSVLLSERSLPQLANVNLTERNVTFDQILKPIRDADESHHSRWNLYAGIFVNINRFVPNRNDELKIESFSQSGNPLRNRVGLRLSFESPTFQTFASKANVSLSYNVINKSYSFRAKSIYSENPGDYSTIEVSSLNHIVGLGLNLHLTRHLQMAGEYQRVFNKSELVAIPFAKSYLNLTLSATMKQGPLGLRPFIQYGMPLGPRRTLNVFPINTGIQVKF